MPLQNKTPNESENIVEIIDAGKLFISNTNLSKDTLNILHSTHEFWDYLLLHLRFADIQLLSLLYMPKPTTSYFEELVAKMSRCNIKRTAVRNTLGKLSKIGLVETINSGLLCVCPVLKLNEQMRKFVVLAKMRFGLKNG